MPFSKKNYKFKMADDDQEIKPYKLVNEQGEEFATSKGFTGKGVAEYPGGDRYEGEFHNGVT